MEVRKDQYSDYVKAMTPVHNTMKNVGCAFLSGGSICCIGQGIGNWLESFGMKQEEASVWTLLILVFFSVLLTGCNLFQKAVHFAGAGILVPITGFANAVASPALEYKAEGQVFGIGCKIFTIAGPVILYGILSSWGLGLIYWMLSAVF